MNSASLVLNGLVISFQIIIYLHHFPPPTLFSFQIFPYTPPCSITLMASFFTNCCYTPCLGFLLSTLACLSWSLSSSSLGSPVSKTLWMKLLALLGDRISQQTILWPLQSFLPFFHNVPLALQSGVVL